MPKNPPVTDAKTIGQTAKSYLTTLHADWSVDELLLHPDQAKEICRRTNLRLGRKLEHHEILRSLLNCRKRGDLKS